MPAPMRVLRSVKLLAGLDEQALQELASQCQERTFTRGSPVTSMGSRGSSVCIIAEGEATVRVRGEVRSRLGPGDTFGALAVIDGGRRAADITAETDLYCYGLSPRAFKAFVLAHPDFGWALLEHVVGLLRDEQAKRPPATPRRRRLGRHRARA